jgi:hypothetical protein
MPFPFFCPQGHILEAEIEQVGQAAACPFCGTEMLIPSPGNWTRQAGLPAHGADQSQPHHDPAMAATSPLEIAPDGVDDGMPMGTSGLASAAETGPDASVEEQWTFSGIATSSPIKETTAEVLHIPCPHGHVLETPPDMLGTPVMCPICRTTFEPQYELSQEYRQKREEMAARAAERAARFWLNLAIGAAILVLGGLIMLIIFAPR